MHLEIHTHKYTFFALCRFLVSHPPTSTVQSQPYCRTRLREDHVYMERRRHRTAHATHRPEPCPQFTGHREDRTYRSQQHRTSACPGACRHPARSGHSLRAGRRSWWSHHRSPSRDNRPTCSKVNARGPRPACPRRTLWQRRRPSNSDYMAAKHRNAVRHASDASSHWPASVSSPQSLANDGTSTVGPKSCRKKRVACYGRDNGRSSRADGAQPGHTEAEPAGDARTMHPRAGPRGKRLTGHP